MALVSWYHEGLNRFVQFAEESRQDMARMGWVRKDDPDADVTTPEVAALDHVEPAVPPPIGDDIVQGAQPTDIPPADGTSSAGDGEKTPDGEKPESDPENPAA